MTRVVFLGSPAAALPALAAARRTFEVALVVTRPDRPKGRSRRVAPGPVAEAAAEAGLPLVQPRDRAELFSALAEAGPFDLGLVVAYGMMLSAEVLALAPHGFVNLHFSVLPRWRGAAPVARALLAGDRRTGVSLMRIDEGLDTGPVAAVTSTAIAADDDAGSLTERLARRAAGLVSNVLPGVAAGRVVFVRQPDEGATYAPKIDPSEVRLVFDEPAEGVVRRVRAFAPRPGAYLMVGERRLKVLKATVVAGSASPGEVHRRDGELVVGAGAGLVRLDVVQPEGKRPMAAADWLRGVRDLPARVD